MHHNGDDIDLTNHKSMIMVGIDNNTSIEFIKDNVSKSITKTSVAGIILYSKRNPYLVKALRDNDFWNSLDDISSNIWTIYAVKPKDIDESSSKNKSNKLSRMIEYGCASFSEKYPVLKDFGIDDSSDLPQFAVFLWDKEDNYHQVNIKINGKDESSIRESLEKIVETITSAIKKDSDNELTVFKNVKTTLLKMKCEIVILDVAGKIIPILDFLAMIIGLIK